MGTFGCPRWAIAFVLFLAVPLSRARPDDPVTGAQAYLQAAQLPGGGFAGIPLIDAAEVARVLGDSSARDLALFALAQERPDNTEAAIARAHALLSSVYSDHVTVAGMLTALADGELGLGHGWNDGDAVLIARALRFVVDAPSSIGFGVLDAGTLDMQALSARDVIVPRLLARLTEAQRADGGFGYADEGADVTVTTEVISALAALPNESVAAAMLARARNWLDGHEAHAGAFGAAELALFILAKANFPGDLQFLSARLAERQDLDGSFEGDHRSTALAIRALVASLPNLTLTVSALAPSQVGVGQQLSIPVHVRNTAGTGAPASEVHLHLLDASGTVLASGEGAIPALAGGSAFQTAISATAPAAAGTYTLRLRVNGNHVFQEGTFDDNLLTMTLTVTGPPDLVVEPVDISLEPPPVAFAASRVAVRVRNTGKAMAENVHVQVYAGPPEAGGQLVLETVLNTVGPGVPRRLEGTFVPRSVYPIVLVARVDPANAISEVDDTNNRAEVSVVPSMPDEILTDGYAYLNSSTATAPQGTPVTLTWGGRLRFWRFGLEYGVRDAIPLTSVPVALYQVGADGAALEVARGNVEALGATSQFPYSMPPDVAPGTYRFRVVVDPDLIGRERSPADNTAEHTVTITNPGLPELMFVAGSVKLDARGIDEDHPTILRARVRNTGLAPASGVEVNFAFPATTAVRIISLLLPGQDEEVAVPVSTAEVPTYADVVLTIDPSGAIEESSKANNTTQVRILNQTTAVAVTDAVASPSPVSPGQAYVVSALVSNEGIATIQGLRGEVYNGGNRVGWAAVAHPIPPGESAVVQVAMPPSTYVLPTALTFKAQPTNPPGQSASLDFTLAVASADVAVASRGVTLQHQTVNGMPVLAPSVVVDNLGGTPCVTSVRIYRGYPSAGDLVAAGSIEVTAASAAVFTAPAFTWPSGPPYVVTAVLDEEAVLPESDETNNLATRPIDKQVGEVLVAFDETNGSEYTVGLGETSHGAAPGTLGDFARDLEARGYEVRSIDASSGGLTPTKLRAVDVLVKGVFTELHSASEIQLLRDFVRAGGGLFTMGDRRVPDQHWWWGPTSRQINEVFGLKDAEADLASGQRCSALYQAFGWGPGEILNHPITDGVQLIVGDLTGGYSEMPEGTNVLIKAPATWNQPHTIVAGAFPFGEGRVVFHGDSSILGSWYWVDVLSGCGGGVNYRLGDNRRFVLQAIDWLANDSELDFPPDLAFTPGVLQVTDASPVAGEAVEFRATVRNIGGGLAALPPTAVRFFDGEPGNGIVLGEIAVPSLPVDQPFDVALHWDTSLASGDHEIVAVIDPDGSIAEYSEANNRVSVHVRVRAAVDLRVDGPDLALTPGSPPVLAIKVHNVGYAAAPAGTSLQLSMIDGDSVRPLGTLELPPVPPREAVTVNAPWPGEFPSSSFIVEATLDPEHRLTDPDRSTNGASLRVEPPAVEIQTPLSGSRWGGIKTIRWTAGSETRPDLLTFVSIGRAGGSFSGLGTAREALDLDTRLYADGEYVLRVTGSDGLQSTFQDVAFTIANAASAVRSFAGAASWSSPVPGGTATVLIPAGSRVTNAMLALDVTGQASAPMGGTWPQDPHGGSLVEYRGRLHSIYTRNRVVYEQVSDDAGATWAAAVQLSAPGEEISWHAAAVNAFGIQHVYQLTGSPGRMLARRSQDGRTWSPPVYIGSIPSGVFNLHAGEEGIALVGAPAGRLTVATADAQGTSWSSPAPLETRLVQPDRMRGVVAAGMLRVVMGVGQNPYNSLVYREVPLDRQADLAAWSAPVTLATELAIRPRLEAMGDRVHLSYQIYGEPKLWFQQCKDLSRCSERDAWLPESVAQPWAGTSLTSVFQGRVRDRLRLAWYAGGGWYSSDVLRNGEQLGGARLTDAAFMTDTYGTFAATESYLAFAGSVANRFGFAAYPRLTPRRMALDVGDDGSAEVVRAGGAGEAHQSADLTDALNAYLASHLDTDDGTADGYVAVPLRLSGTGVGTLVLRNLEVGYESSAAVAAWAQPRVFSPGTSPGVLDVTLLSLDGGDAVTVRTAAGVPVRVLSTEPTAGRRETVFDGRAADGALLPSGPYSFGASTGAGGLFEIDDIPPLVSLETGGVYGGTQAVRGTATDRDYAGSSKNFARYILEYSLDGQIYLPLAAGTAPVEGGALATWNTNALPLGPAWLRLTAWDDAGNSESVTRSVSTDPSAPGAPRIVTPTEPSHPLDVFANAVTVGGTADPNVNVTVTVGHGPVGTVASDSLGRWALAGVQVPAGTSTLSAFAERGGVRGPDSAAIVLARYALSLALQGLPQAAPRGTTIPFTATVSRTSVEARDLTIRLRIVDESGHDVGMAPTPSELTASMPASGSASFQAEIATGLAPAGSYRVVAQAVAGHRAPAIVMEPLKLEAQPSVAARVASDRAVYDPMQVVTLNSVVTNAPTSLEMALAGELTLYGPDGSVTVIGPLAFGFLSPGRNAVRASLFAPGVLAPGTYLVDLAVVDELARPIATAATSFDVEVQSATALSGGLEVTPPEYQAGDALNASYQIRNDGPFTNASVSLMLVSQASGAVVARHDEALPLARGESANGDASLSTATADGTDLVALLLGNGRVLAADTVVPSPWRDESAPVITVAGVVPGEHRSAAIAPVVTITDESPFTSEITLDGTPYVSGSPVEADGTYSLFVSVEDVHANASSVTVPFTVDRTAPELSASVSDGAAYPAPLTVQFSAQDLHLESFTSRLDGSPVASGEVLVAPGPHVLSLTARDVAGNETSRTITFQVSSGAGVEIAKLVGGAGRRVLTFILEKGGTDGTQSSALRQLVEASVTEGTVSSALTESAFKAGLRSDAFDTFVVGRLEGNASTTAPLMSDLTGLELGAAVFRGKGLYFVQDFASQWWFMDFPLGIWFHSDQPPGSVHLNASAFSSEGNLGTPGGVKLGINSASTVGTWPTGTTAVSSNAFGLGASVVVGFDPVVATPPAPAQALVRDGISFVAPDQVAALPRGTIPVTVRVKNLGPAAQLRIDETLDPAVAVVAVLDGGTASGASTLSWATSLEHDAEARLRYVARFPAAAGAYPAATRVYVVGTGGESLQGTASVDLVLEDGASELMARARTLTEQLPTAGDNGTHRANILASLDWLMAYEAGGVTAEEKEWGIQQLVYAAWEARSLTGVDLILLSFSISNLLGYWEAR